MLHGGNQMLSTLKLEQLSVLLFFLLYNVFIQWTLYSSSHTETCWKVIHAKQSSVATEKQIFWVAHNTVIFNNYMFYVHLPQVHIYIFCSISIEELKIFKMELEIRLVYW